jgi:hypothetical protein
MRLSKSDTIEGESDRNETLGGLATNFLEITTVAFWSDTPGVRCVTWNI